MVIVYKHHRSFLYILHKFLSDGGPARTMNKYAEGMYIYSFINTRTERGW